MTRYDIQVYSTEFITRRYIYTSPQTIFWKQKYRGNCAAAYTLSQFLNDTDSKLWLYFCLPPLLLRHNDGGDPNGVNTSVSESHKLIICLNLHFFNDSVKKCDFHIEKRFLMSFLTIIHWDHRSMLYPGKSPITLKTMSHFSFVALQLCNAN